MPLPSVQSNLLLALLLCGTGILVVVGAHFLTRVDFFLKHRRIQKSITVLGSLLAIFGAGFLAMGLTIHICETYGWY